MVEKLGKVIEKNKEPAGSVLLLTKDAAEAKAALANGMSAILVLTHRRNIEKLDEEAKKIPRGNWSCWLPHSAVYYPNASYFFYLVRSFHDLAFI